MIKTLGIVVKKQNIGETDRIITILSPSIGKKRVVARAVRKPLSKLSGHLDTFMVSQLILTEEVELPKVTSAVLVESFEQLRASLDRVERGYAVARIAERIMVEDEPQQAIFQTVVDALARIDTDVPWTAVWLRYLAEVATNLGVQPSNFSCSSCGKNITDAAYWDGEERRFICQDCSKVGWPVQANTVKMLRILFSSRIREMHRIMIPVDIAHETEEILLREITQLLPQQWGAYRGLMKK